MCFVNSGLNPLDIEPFRYFVLCYHLLLQTVNCKWNLCKKTKWDRNVFILLLTHTVSPQSFCRDHVQQHCTVESYPLFAQANRTRWDAIYSQNCTFVRIRAFSDDVSALFDQQQQAVYMAVWDILDLLLQPVKMINLLVYGSAFTTLLTQFHICVCLQYCVSSVSYIVTSLILAYKRKIARTLGVWCAVYIYIVVKISVFDILLFTF